MNNTQEKAQHTPGPWETDGLSIDARETHIGYVDTCDTNAGLGRGEGEANARRIVQCVNSHDALVEALRLIESATCSDARSVVIARAAIAKVGGAA